jgi:hypothetical protein
VVIEKRFEDENGITATMWDNGRRQMMEPIPPVFHGFIYEFLLLCLIIVVTLNVILPSTSLPCCIILTS